MKRNLLLTLTLCLAAMGALAVERSQEQARQIALGTARQQGATQVSAYGSVAATRAKGTKQAPNQPYYIFNKENNKGFIIVSGDDRMPDVLGYTDKGAFDAANTPPH